MTRQEAKRIKQWLYSIPATERAVINLEQATEELKEKLSNPPSYLILGVANYSGIAINGGGFSHSKQDNYTAWQETKKARLEFLEDVLQQKKRKVKQYRETLEMLKQEPKWGYLAGEIIRKKYYCKVRPDKAIYTMFLFISPEWYYKLHRRALQYFYDVLPDVFLEKKNTAI